VNRAGISSTPFFIIADSLSIRGAAEAGQFQAVLDSLLAAENE
jgi:predicted DsbA family dithiol-disulfide isomerase